MPAPTVFFLSDSTGITAETLGNTLLTQFPGQRLERRTIPFITTSEQAREVVALIDRVADSGSLPIIFSTAVGQDIRAILSRSRGQFFDLFGTHIGQLEQTLGAQANGKPGQAHGVGDAVRYQSPHGRRRIRDRARRRSVASGARTRRADTHRAVAVRENSHHHVPGPATRHPRRELPPGGGRLRHHDSPETLAALREQMFRADLPARSPQPDPAGTPPGQQLRLTESVRLRAAQCRGHVPGQQHPLRQLRVHVRGRNIRHRPPTHAAAPLMTLGGQRSSPTM
ncbi:conserved hypothetical protein [Paenarthrobacter aurescens TC1]|uniref:Phosphoenolpyruvate synthase regulatory protein n=1 Tax=Paenarthrobacter aurescens (strain TC1) TaxID=290340 RepID=A1R5Y2_PAEAT|nr:conserved hypothetical protein [Paenarthrobacter aurescens TC1]